MAANKSRHGAHAVRQSSARGFTYETGVGARGVKAARKMNCQVLRNSGGLEQNSASDTPSPVFADQRRSFVDQALVVCNDAAGTNSWIVDARNPLSRGVQLEQQLSSDPAVLPSGELSSQQSEKICGYAEANAHAFVAGNQPINIRVRTVVRKRFTSRY